MNAQAAIPIIESIAPHLSDGDIKELMKVLDRYARVPKKMPKERTFKQAYGEEVDRFLKQKLKPPKK